jgi:dCTP deaminase
MVLSDGEIWAALESGEIEIDPPPDPTGRSIQPSSIDLNLDGRLRIQKGEPLTGVSLYPPALNITEFLNLYTDPCDIDEHLYEMQPGRFVIAKTLEHIRLPLGIAARVEGKSSLARLGVAVHITAPKIDPGYDNNITLEMYNFGPFTVQLKKGMPICVLILERLGQAAKQGYSGRFQGK